MSLAILGLSWAIWSLSKPVFGFRSVFSSLKCNPVLTLCFIPGLCKMGGWLGPGVGTPWAHPALCLVSLLANGV